MSSLDDALRGHPVVIEFPRTGVEDWVAVAEVLLQEGLQAWVLPPELFHLAPEMLALYGFRARVGACGVTDAEGVRAATAAGLQYVLSPVSSAGLADAAHGVPFLGGALTPTEVAAAVQAGADAVAICPADALGTAYARALPPMFPGVGIVPWGRLERFQCEMWLDAGAAAVVIGDVILRAEDGSGSNATDEVGRRAAAFAPLLKRG